MKKNYPEAPISPAERAMLDFVVKMTHHPRALVRADLDLLRDHGFDDTAILEIAHISGFFNYINRVADALGVDPEPEWGSSDRIG